MKTESSVMEMEGDYAEAVKRLHDELNSFAIG